jgi:hypothetical protein
MAVWAYCARLANHQIGRDKDEADQDQECTCGGDDVPGEWRGRIVVDRLPPLTVESSTLAMPPSMAVVHNAH